MAAVDVNLRSPRSTWPRLQWRALGQQIRVNVGGMPGSSVWLPLNRFSSKDFWSLYRKLIESSNLKVKVNLGINDG